MTTLQVSDVSKKYKTKVVLSSMSLEAKKGNASYYAAETEPEKARFFAFWRVFQNRPPGTLF